MDISIRLSPASGGQDHAARPYASISLACETNGSIAPQLPVQIEMLIVRCKQDQSHGRAEDARAAGPALSGCPHPSDPIAGVPQRPRPAPDAHASLLKLPIPSNYFLCRDPRAEFAPSCLGECAIAARHEPEHRTMWYRKNVGGGERAARLIGGGLMLICGVVALHASPLGLLLSGAGVVTLVTGVFGYCPACAIAGREPLKG
jgi:hypothetical protein